MNDIIMETPRLYLRKITMRDYAPICEILQNAEVMYAWGHAFDDNEVKQWFDKNFRRYTEDGYSYLAVIEKTGENLIGVCGLLAEQADGENYVGIGYIFNKKYWRRGFAFESAKACMDYAFDVLRLNEVIAQIRPENTPSIKIAEKLKMTAEKQFIKHYKGQDMPHLLYIRRRIS